MRSADLIKYVEASPCVTGTELGKICGMHPGSCASALAKLYKKGLITRYLGLSCRSKFLKGAYDLAVNGYSVRRVSMVWRYMSNGAKVNLSTLVGIRYASGTLDFAGAQRVILVYQIACLSSNVCPTKLDCTSICDLLTTHLTAEDGLALRVWHTVADHYTLDEMVNRVHA